jgi:subtilisin-like proprotein convertase family protein
MSFCPDGVESSTASGSGVHCTIDGCSHGTHVAGIVAGRNGPNGRTGVAPDASIIAIQVFTHIDTETICGVGGAPCVRSYTSDQLQGLERIYTLRDTYNIAAVNLSLGGGRYSNAEDCDTREGYDAYRSIVANLRSADIAVVAASGNNGYTDSMSYPACISNIISVGATGDGSGGWTEDSVASFSNSADFLDLLAPGALTTSSVPGGGYANYTGTSMAAPHVAGAWAVLREVDSTSTTDIMLSTLKTTGVNITDWRAATDSRVTPRIQLDAAVSALENPTIPTAPTNLAAEARAASTTESRIIWDDNSINEDYFHLQRRASGGSWQTIDDTIAANTTSYIDSGLACGTEYGYRVRATNNTGSSDWSNIDTTTPGSAKRFTYEGSPVSIIDLGTVTVELPVPDAATISDIDVQLDVLHGWVADLDMYLISPAGTRVLLVDDEGTSGDNFSGTIFDDEAVQPITSASAPFTGHFQPEGSLAAFDGENTSGTWILEVTDDTQYVAGTITNVALDITTSSMFCALANQSPIIAQGDSVTVNMDEDGTPTAFRLVLNASDADGDTLLWSISDAADHGTATAAGTGASRSISYTADADYNGSDSFVVQVEDSHGNSDSITVDVNIAAINDAPEFTKGPNIAVTEDAGPQSISGWATTIQPGPASAIDESAQGLTFTLEMTNTTGSLSFDENPAIDPTTGDLTFHATDATTGTVIVQAQLSDDGNNISPHKNTSIIRQFSIAVGIEGPTGILDNVIVKENTSETVIDLFAAFEDVHNSDADLMYVVQENTDPSLVSTVIDGTTGTLRLQYAPNTDGTALITVRVTDTDNNFTDATFEVTVEPMYRVYLPSITQ